MKKVFAILLAAALVATLSVVAFADLPADEEKTLTVDFADMTATSTVYSVDVEWDSDLEFNYYAGQQGAWNPEDHDYATTTQAGWTDDEVAVVVTNHSNAAISAKLDVVDANEEDDVIFTGTAATPIASAVGTAVAEAPSATLKVTVSGDATADIAAAATATLKITAA